MRQRAAGLATGKMPMPKPTLRQRLALLWRWLNQPLPGTSPRQAKPVIWVEGRIPGKALNVLAFLLLAGMLADMAGWWQAPSFDPFQPYFAWTRSLICETGWGGYSQGLWGVAGGIVLFGFLPAWLMWACLVHQACQLIRRRTNLPSRGKPWFPMVLLEGRAAVWRGWCLLLAAGLALCMLLWATYLFYAWLPQLLLPPSALKVC
ncbi:hypothetical protein [Dentiradicibacter hellwigii]|uniref:Uncharacterized protein n=1 Tax=Dentiradicibacter hellwigii TaxID=3149053 RepID=A0ABV4UAW6_9RHOO